jgi:hypothetical protein
MKFKAAFDLAADTPTLVYTGGASKEAVVIVNVCARTQPANVRVASTHDAAPTDADWIEFDVPLVVGGAPLLREGIPCAADDRIYVQASETGVSVVVWDNDKSV